jgi:competence protein ComEA
MFLAVKVSRRTPAPDPGERQHALARLKAASLTPVRREASGPPGWVPKGPVAEPAVDEVGRDEVVRGGWVPESVLPERLRGSRWALAPRHVAVVVAVLVVGLGWALWSLVQARPETVPDAQPAAGIVSGSPVVQPSRQPTPGSTPSAPAQVLVVDVAGKVRRPGLVRAKAGARVADVLAAAGGALPGVDLTGLNLARKVTDGEQILVGVPGGAPVGTPTGPASPGGTPAGGPVDLNTATMAQLEDLPGVGPVLAQRIVDWRTEHGRFTSVDELQEVSGVGEKKFESLKPHVRV